jgi:two-component system OmpR family sensor kinase
MPLRARLVAVVLLLVTVALIAIGTAGVTVIRGQLLAATDTQLGLVADSSLPSPLGGNPPEKPAGGQAGADPNVKDRPMTTMDRPTSGASFVVQVQQRDADGKLVKDQYQIGGFISSQLPARAARLDVPEDAAWLDEHAGHPMTIPASTGDGSLQVLVQPLADSSGWVVVSTDLRELNATISYLVTANLIVGAVVLLLLAIASVALVRASLRPLVKVEKTAAAIAAGDLTQRVPEQPPQTELGRLSHALNGMLTQIEEAFRVRAQSESLARQSEDRMRRFVSDAGHELRTPLSVIRAWGDYSHQGPRRDRAELERILTTVGTEANRMSTLVEDLQLLARLDRQRLLERHPVDVLTLAVDAVRDARLLAPERDIELAVDDRLTYTVIGDELRLRQVLSNLTSNALTHTPPGTPVSIKLGPGRLDEAPALVLDVTDQGPGLTPEQAERVFERFYRTDASRTRRTGGSGLGLAIVASLAAAHAGTVSAHSPPGAGATFRVTLPLADTNAPSSEPGERADDPSKP